MKIKIISAPVLIVTCGLIAGCGNLDDHTPSQSVTYAPDGTLAVFTVEDIRLFDQELRKETHRPIPTVKSQNNGPYDYVAVDSFILSADGTTAAVSYAKPEGGVSMRNAVELFRIPTGELVNDIDIDVKPEPPIARTINVGLVALSPHGDLFFAQNRAAPPDAMPRESDSAMFRVSDGARLWGRYWLTSPVFSADGQTLFSTFLPGDPTSSALNLMAIDALTGMVRFSVEMTGLPDIDLVENGQLIAGVWDSQGGTEFALWSAVDGSLVRNLPQIPGTQLYGTHPAGYPAFACWLTGDLCAVGLGDPNGGASVKIWKTDGTLVQTLRGFVDANDLAFSPDGQLIALAGEKTAVYRISDGALVSQKTFRLGIF
jgi:WD40 repeat protein